MRVFFKHKWDVSILKANNQEKNELATFFLE